MIGPGDEILYIGKAISLRNRVRSYFQEGAIHHPRTAAMIERVVDVRTIVVNNEVEALILEANLIKRYQPPYNVRLRDDKRYPYLKVTSEPFSRVVFTRAIKDDGARYFGPYTNAHGLRELIDLIRLVFPLRTCREPIDGRRKRPCLQYHIKRCLAPCVGYQSEFEHDAMVDEVLLFLEGKQESLLARLQVEMSAAADGMKYEAAARIRDRIVAVRRVTERQQVVWKSRLDMDLVAIARARGQACVQVFLVRGGKLIGQEHFILDGVADRPDAELLAEFLKQFYTARTASAPQMPALSSARAARDNQAPVAEKARSRAAAARAAASAVPKEILTQLVPDEREVIAAWLSTLKGQRVRVLHAQRGPRAEYLRLVQKNAEQNLKAFLAHQEVQETAQSRALTDLANALELPEPPHRIECYDISNIQGTNPVASMVVFVEGRAKKSEYRKFKIQYDRGPNDFAMMQETLRRRLRYLRRETDESASFGERELAKKEKFDKRPDLLLIDGGPGQVASHCLLGCVVVRQFEHRGFRPKGEAPAGGGEAQQRVGPGVVDVFEQAANSGESSHRAVKQRQLRSLLGRYLHRELDGIGPGDRWQPDDRGQGVAIVAPPGGRIGIGIVVNLLTIAGHRVRRPGLKEPDLISALCRHSRIGAFDR